MSFSYLPPVCKRDFSALLSRFPLKRCHASSLGFEERIEYIDRNSGRMKENNFIYIYIFLFIYDVTVYDVDLYHKRLGEGR